MSVKRLALIAAILAVPSVADAFCGFYVAGSGDKLFNDATQVVLMRQGTRTVLAMQNHYQGPTSEFAMVVPVPVVLQEADVKTLPDAVFDKVDQMGAPRLVEYWEIDPCFQERHYDEDKVAMSPTAAMEAGSGVANAQGVTIEAKFEVGEYKILILSAKDSTGLDTWLRAEKYQIPKDAEPLLRPYVEHGMKFFVAKVDPQKVKFEGNKAMLSPLRFHYDSEEFALPIRLGLANSNGTQDLIVNILAPRQRYEVANYKNVTIPTNIDLSAKMKDKFPAFYTALFDRTIERNPGAVITEYAWDASTCDPCPGPNLDYGDFATLGADVLEGSREQPRAYQNGDFVLTRLHARYGKAITNDLVFKAVEPIAGGREHTINQQGKLEEGSQPSSSNNFQARYAIRHLWTGPVACDAPVRGRWGGPPDSQSTGPTAATKLAFAPRGGVDLAAVIKTDIPELGIKAASRTIATGGGFDPRPTKKKTGCGCAASDSGGLLFGGLVFAFALRRRRPASRRSALEGQ